MRTGFFRRSRMFTLLEVLVVIAIIVILAGVLGGVLISMSNRAKNEGAANQIKKILAALEQFQQDFGEYPTTDAGLSGVTESKWAEHNTLAFRLCQDGGFGTGVIATQTVVRNNRQTWCGSYLTSEDFPIAQIIQADSPAATTAKDQLLDFWGNPLAYCMAPYDSTPTTFTVTASPLVWGNSTSKLYDNSTNLPTDAGNGVPSSPTSATLTTDKYAAYRINNKMYARPVGSNYTSGSCGVCGRSYSTSNPRHNGYLPPISYAMQNTWVDNEVKMPEVWSAGSDNLAAKWQYKSGSTYFKAPLTVSGTTVYPDQDNVGGNLNVMKIQ